VCFYSSTAWRDAPNRPLLVARAARLVRRRVDAAILDVTLGAANSRSLVDPRCVERSATGSAPSGQCGGTTGPVHALSATGILHSPSSPTALQRRWRGLCGSGTWCSSRGQDGETFSSILDGVRTELARRYIDDRGLPLSDVAYRLGFANLSGFSRWFRGEFNCSPTSWRATPGAPSSPG